MLKTHVLSLPFYMVLIIVAVVIVTLVIIVVEWRRANVWPYRKVSLMSGVEKKLYWQLKEALPEHYIFSQVHLSQIIRPPKGKHELKWLNKIWRMSVDYVILDKHLEVQLVIELDDKTHLLPRRQAADQKKNKALAVAGVKLMRVQTSNMPSKQQLKEQLNRYLK